MTMTKTTSGGSKILVIGGTGTIGRHIVAASLEAGHPTLVLVRRSPAPAAAAAGVDPDKAKLLASLEASGATLVYGDMNDHESLVAAIKRADVVISAVGHRGTVELDGQLKVVDAIKEAGNIKRFVPSEYGCDVEQAEAATLEPARSIIAAKVRVREAVRAAAIPHTFICSYWAHGFMLPRLGDPPGHRPPPPAPRRRRLRRRHPASHFRGREGHERGGDKGRGRRAGAEQDPVRAAGGEQAVAGPARPPLGEEVRQHPRETLRLRPAAGQESARVSVPGELPAGDGALDAGGRRVRAGHQPGRRGGGDGALPGHGLPHRRRLPRRPPLNLDRSIHPSMIHPSFMQAHFYIHACRSTYICT
uniref:NmrA-like domain-containing protein n=1 Tax=Oryza brachyantha TaxID=4533 RepID=J3KY35_ORYBR